MVARSGKEVHQESFGRFGLVDDGFGTDVETADGEGVDVVFREKGGDDLRVSEGVAGGIAERYGGGEMGDGMKGRA